MMTSLEAARCAPSRRHGAKRQSLCCCSLFNQPLTDAGASRCCHQRASRLASVSPQGEPPSRALPTGQQWRVAAPAGAQRAGGLPQAAQTAADQPPSARAAEPPPPPPPPSMHLTPAQMCPGDGCAHQGVPAASLASILESNRCVSGERRPNFTARYASPLNPCHRRARACAACVACCGTATRDAQLSLLLSFWRMPAGMQALGGGAGAAEPHLLQQAGGPAEARVPLVRRCRPGGCITVQLLLHRSSALMVAAHMAPVCKNKPATITALPQDWLLRLAGARQRAAGPGPRRGVCTGACCRLAQGGCISR